MERSSCWKMGNDYQLYEKISFEGKLPVIFHRDRMTKAVNPFICHWHDKMEFLYFLAGEAVIKCNSEEISAKSGDLIIINSNELHEGFCVTEPVVYDCIIVDISMLENSRCIDTNQARYISDINESRILFKNKISGDGEIGRCVDTLANEFADRNIGYEMAVKSAVYDLLVRLLRNYVKLKLSKKEYDAHIDNLKRINVVLEYIDRHFNEKMTADQLASLVNLSKFYFCHLFKSLTGQS